MGITRTVAVALLVLSGLVSAPETRAQGQVYLGGSFGKSDFDDGNAIPDLITSGTVDGSDTGIKIFAGYEFNRNFGVELAFVDLGKASYSGTFVDPFSGPLTVTGGSVDTSGVNISAVGILPLNPSFELFGKVGIFAWEAEARDTTDGSPFSAKADDADVSFGLGASYNISANVSVRAEWERFEAVGDIDLISLGILFRF